MAPSKRSHVWKFFTKDEGTKTATCKYCSNTYKNNGNTSTLGYHLKRKHPDLLENVGIAVNLPNLAVSYKEEPVHKITKRVSPDDSYTLVKVGGDEKDESAIFGDLIAYKLRKLPNEKYRLMAQNKINMILYDLELEVCEQREESEGMS